MLVTWVTWVTWVANVLGWVSRGGVGAEECWCGFGIIIDDTGVKKVVNIFHKACR